MTSVNQDNHHTGQDFDLSIVTVSYNSGERIAATIRANIAATSHLRTEIIVVDNASGDNSVDVARAAVNDSSGLVIANSENIGYGRAANQGISVARGEMCMVMNDDAVLVDGAIDQMMGALVSDESVGLVGPRMIDEEGNAMPSARMVFPGLDEEAALIRDWRSGVNRNAMYPAGTTGDPMEVAWLVGACILSRTELLRRIGGFNPIFFLYSEDTDLGRRVVELGYRNLTVPEAVCVHTGSVSTGRAFSSSAAIQRRAGGRELFYRIWYPRLVRSLVHLRRAIGTNNQPGRLFHHLPRVVWDGRSLRDHRFPPALAPAEGNAETV